jgi:hypothetical protein
MAIINGVMAMVIERNNMVININGENNNERNNINNGNKININNNNENNGVSIISIISMAYRNNNGINMA